MALIETRDLGKKLVRDGIAIVYRKYPFKEMDAYVMAENTARTERRGLWRQTKAVKRAQALQQAWIREK